MCIIVNTFYVIIIQLPFDLLENLVIWYVTEKENLVNMFQCIIQHRNGLIYNAPELKHVFPGNNFMTVIKSICKGNGQEQTFFVF